MAYFISQMEEKAVPKMTNTPYLEPSSIFLALMFTGQEKPNQHLQSIPQTQKFAPYTYPQKWSNGSDPY